MFGFFEHETTICVECKEIFLSRNHNLLPNSRDKYETKIGICDRCLIRFAVSNHPKMNQKPREERGKHERDWQGDNA